MEGEVKVGEDFGDDVGDDIARVVAVLSIGCVVDDDEVGVNCSFSTNAPDLELVVCFCCCCCCSSSLVEIRLILKASLTPKTCSLFPLQ